MISNHEITDVFVFNEHKFSLAHKAALHGSLSVLKFLVKEAGLPPSALQLPDDSFTTPAMLAIQVSLVVHCCIVVPRVYSLSFFLSFLL